MVVWWWRRCGATTDRRGRRKKRIVRDMCSHRMNGQSHRFLRFCLLSIDPWARFPCGSSRLLSLPSLFNLLSSFLSYFPVHPHSLVFAHSPLLPSFPSLALYITQRPQKGSSLTLPQPRLDPDHPPSSSYHNGLTREKVASDQPDCWRLGWIHGGLDLSSSRYHQGPHAALQERCEKRCCKFFLFIFISTLKDWRTLLCYA